MQSRFDKNKGIIYEPIIEGAITWETVRSGSPGKLSFSVINDNSPGEMRLNIQEGNPVTFRWKGQNVFTGFLFTKSRSKDQIIKVTAYDQSRYLKNKASYEYESLTTTQLLQMVANDFLLEVGECDNTTLTLSRREDSITLFDIILNSLDDTIRATKRMYVLYDDFGKLVLKDIENLKIDALMTESTAEDFDYQTSIDNNTYNQIKLYYDNEESSKREVYMARDNSNIGRWGVLQMYEKIDRPEIGSQMASGYLDLYNSKRRSLKVKKAFGDIRARAGASVPVTLTLGDVNADAFLLVENAKHSFEDGSHTMDLTLRGDVFV